MVYAFLFPLGSYSKNSQLKLTAIDNGISFSSLFPLFNLPIQADQLQLASAN